MKKEFKSRYMITGIVFAVIMALLAVRLFDMQMVHGEEYLTKSVDSTLKKLRVTGARGKILDRNGMPLAYNTTSYTVQFLRNASNTGEKYRRKYTQSMIETIKIIEENGGTIIPRFAIQKLEDGTFDFMWVGIDKVADAEKYEARVTQWKKDNCIKNYILKDSTPAEIFDQYCAYYYLDEDMSYEEASNVLAIWQEVRSVYFSSYLPITIATHVDMDTVATIEIRSTELIGMQIAEASSRVYPNKSMAAHIIGYMGQMQDEPTIMAMVDQGYSRADVIGTSGIEKSMEAVLSGCTTDRTGTRIVEVDSKGKITREIESISPVSGNNVMLTLDSGLQKTLEKALEENIALIRAEQETAYRDKADTFEEYLAERKLKKIQYASAGAAVVMDVQTGEVLAMASYPSYDLNIFTGGASKEQYNKLIAQSTSTPLFNNAISSKGTPGSVFKMVTGLAGLMEGTLNLTDTISDDGEYTKHVVEGSGEHGPQCWVRPYFDKHADLDIVKALQFSCNYFFYSVADGLRIERLVKWADLLGLTSKTGVELSSEVAGQVGSQDSLYKDREHMSGVAALVRNRIVKMLKDVCAVKGYQYSEEKYTEVAYDLMDLVNKGVEETGPDIRAILKNELKFTSADLEMTNVSDNVKSQIYSEISIVLTEIKWNPNFTIEAGIGQSVTLVTPIAMARYVSALVNGGDVFDARLVKSIIKPNGDVVDTTPKLVRNLDVPVEYLDAIKKGMQSVVSDEEGTAHDYFANFDYKTDMGGKTGTAEVSQTIELENNSWFVAFAPFDKPEIAVVVYVPSGYKGALSSYTVKAAIQYYMDSKKLTNEQMVLPAVNVLVK